MKKHLDGKNKNDIKIVSFASEEGFVVQNMGCSDPLMAACLMKKDCSADVKLLVDRILEVENDLQAKTSRLDNTTKGKLKKDAHKEAINTAVNLIKSFKKGDVSFSALVERVQNLAAQTAIIPHASTLGKIKGSVGKKTGTKNIVR